MINRRQLYTNQTSLRWKKVNKMRHFTVIADLDVAQKKNLACVLSFFSAYFIPVYSSFKLVKNCVGNGICNFSNIFSIKNYHF